MKTCMYCGNEVNGKAHCGFCEMDLKTEEIMMNGERKKTFVKPIIDVSNMTKKTPELMAMGSYELLVLLKLVRGERSSSYGVMREVKDLIQKAKDENSKDGIDILNSTLQDVIDDYEYITRKAWVIENILLERMDSVPLKITDSYLDKYFDKIQNRKTNPMTFKTGA